jgi:hypothetical protein
MRKLLFLIAGLLLLLSGCEEKSGTVIAEVNGEVLTLEEFQNSFTSVEYNSMTAEQKRDMVNKWVEITLLAQKADEDDFLKDNSLIKFRIANAEKKVKSNAFINKQLSTIKVSDEDLFNYYRLHQGEFSKNAKTFKIQRIFFSDQTQMMNIKSMLDAGTIKFTPAAIKFSQEEIGKFGGYLSEGVTETGAEAEIYKNIQNLKPYEYISMPYKNGFILVRYLEVTESLQDKTFEEMKPEIEKLLINEKRKDIYKNLIKDIKSESNVTISI